MATQTSIGEEGDSQALNRADRLDSSPQNLGAGGRLTVAESNYTLEADLLGQASQRRGAPRLLTSSSTHGLKPKWQEIADAANPAEALYRKLHDDRQALHLQGRVRP